MYLYEVDPPRDRALTACRILLYVVAGACALQVLGLFLAAGVSGATSGAALWTAWPGALSFGCARRLPTAGRRTWQVVVGLQVFALLSALAVLGSHDAHGLPQLILPIAVLTLVVLRRHRGLVPAQAGATTLEYAAILSLVGALVIALVALSIPTQVADHVHPAICQIFEQKNCPTTAKSPTTTSTNSTGNPVAAPAAPPKKKHGGGNWFTKGAGWFGHQAGGLVTGIGGAAWQNVKGLGNIVTDPVGTVKNIGSAFYHHPLQTVGGLFGFDQQTFDDWKHGNYGHAIGRVTWGVGSWFIPYGDIAAKAGDLAKLGEVAGDAGKVSEIAGDLDKAANAASDADKAAEAGDVGRATQDAENAQSEADKAAQDAKKKGCPIGMPEQPGTIVLTAYVRTLPSLPMEDECGTAKDAAAKAAQAWRDAAKAKVKQLRDHGTSNGPISKNNNIAAATLDVDGMAHDTLAGVSGQVDRGSEVVPPVGSPDNPQVFDPVGRPGQPEWHQYDSEANLFNYLANKLGPASDAPHGTIYLYSERTVCTSCEGIIQQFEQRYPNIKVDVRAGP